MTMAMLAVLLRALIPAGYMVSPNDGAGGSRIVICSPQGAVEVLVDASGHRIKAPINHDKGKVADHPCVGPGSDLFWGVFFVLGALEASFAS